MGTNLAILEGHLGADPEVRYTSEGGIAVANFQMAINERWNDAETGEKHERTEWVRIVAWRKHAENAGEFLHKGSHALVQGTIRTRPWVDKDGVKRQTTEVHAQRITYLDKKEGSGKFTERDDPGPADIPDDDIPF